MGGGPAIVSRMSDERKDNLPQRLSEKEIEFLNSAGTPECKRIAGFFNSLGIEDALAASGFTHREAVAMMVDLMRDGNDSTRLKAYELMRKIIKENAELSGDIEQGHMTRKGTDAHGNPITQTVTRSRYLASGNRGGYGDGESAEPVVRYSLDAQEQEASDLAQGVRGEKARRDQGRESLEGALGARRPPDLGEGESAPAGGDDPEPPA